MSSPAELAYKAIANLYPDQIYRPSSEAFSDVRGSFWNARQQDAHPTCIFQPTSAEQVAGALVEVVRAKCPFAVKSGGHSSNARGSSIDDGLLFDLAKIDHIEVSEDRRSVRLGPGLRWAAVFEHLQKQKLIAVGGRDATVGVPGFIFGGGLSNHGTQRGWGLDSLVAVDIVLANGELVTANSNRHSDLFRALLGGGPQNFGIVTSLTIKVYPHNGMWGGFIKYTPEHLDEVFAAYDTYTQGLATEGKAHTILHFQVSDEKTQAMQWMAHPDPVADPGIFHDFQAIPRQASTLRLASATELADEVHRLTFSTNKRNTYWTYTYEYDTELLQDVVAKFTQAFKAAPSRFTIAMEINHITPAHRLGASRDGKRNVLGLDTSDKMLLIVLLAGVWDKKEDDELVELALEKVGNEFDEIARARNKLHSYRYMNYANHRQSVLSNFSNENKTFLREVATKYDPYGVFQQQNLAGFKLESESGA